MRKTWMLIGLFLYITASIAQENDREELGRLQTGAVVTFVKNTKNEWGIDISGGSAPNILQEKPVQIEVYKSSEDIFLLDAGYKTIKRSASGIDAFTEMVDNENVVFRVQDRWSVDGAIVSVKRKVEVSENAQGGFNSSLLFNIDTCISWSDMNCMIPGALYGDPTYNGDRSVCGKINYEAHRLIMREDIIPAPLAALSFKNGSSVSLLDPAPQGASTVEETKLTKNVMIDSRFLFGAIEVRQTAGNPIMFGFRFPGSMSITPFGAMTAVKPRRIQRFHPISQGVVHEYEINLRFGQNEPFRDVIRSSWRWAWNTLKPTVPPIDVELVRRVLIDHLVSQANVIDGRTGIPFAVATFDTNQLQWNRTMTAMGFVSKNIECADQLLREGDRDTTKRGQKMRKIGLGIISSMINALNTVPLQATGYDLATGKPWTGDRQEWLAPWLRNATEDMRVLMRAYRRERAHGIQHPEWFNWVKQYADWLLPHQREDGSFPRRWKAGSNDVEEPTGTTSYCPVPLLVMISEETGDSKYQQSAIRAAEYIWTNFGSRGLFVGGASDNPNITDKEAGMLSLEAFLSLYESTKDTKWLERAKTAADFSESWMWIWNLPMPVDADNSMLHWKKGVPTIGLQGITARGPGGADEYLDWSAPSYAKLYKYTNDQHYLDVAWILLHATKSMVALPGRQYDLKGIGWQQEGWSLGPNRNGRGVGGHRFWLPWISANHLYSITGLEELDPVLYKRIIK
ncbi:MAG: AGE family epimerase/isomerase [Bacteroidetes bacterium]|nr:AGE family epimerase/isomerase [Bacteroidota bacterium]